MLQAVVDAGATEHIGAGLHQRTQDRTTRRNGTRDKLVTTAAGDLTVKIPKLRSGSFFPALLCPRRRIDVALHAVVIGRDRRVRSRYPAIQPSPLCESRGLQHRPRSGRTVLVNPRHHGVDRYVPVDLAVRVGLGLQRERDLVPGAVLAELRAPLPDRLPRPELRWQSRHANPVRSRKIDPSTNGRCGRSVLSIGPFSAGSSGSIRAHISSVSTSVCVTSTEHQPSGPLNYGDAP